MGEYELIVCDACNVVVGRFPRWIPISEGLPEIKQMVLINTRGAKRAKEAYLTPINTWRVWGGEYQFDAVTFWMPLPELPEKQI